MDPQILSRLRYLQRGAPLGLGFQGAKRLNHEAQTVQVIILDFVVHALCIGGRMGTNSLDSPRTKRRMPERFLLLLQLKLLHDVPVPLCHNFLTGLNRLEILYSYGSLQNKKGKLTNVPKDNPAKYTV